MKEKRLRDVLGLSKFYSDASRHRVPFMVMLDVELARLLEWLSPSEEERAAKEMVCALYMLSSSYRCYLSWS